MDLGKRIAVWREWKGLSQHDVADALDLTRAAIFQWETGDTSPSLPHLEQFVTELIGITMERFYGRTPKPRKAA